MFARHALPPGTQTGLSYLWIFTQISTTVVLPVCVLVFRLVLFLKQFTWFHHLGSKLAQRDRHHLLMHNVNTNVEVTSQ